MEARGYTRLDRRSVLRTLESRLSASQTPVQGPHVQLFRVSSPPDTAPPTFAMPYRRPGEEHLPHEEPSEDVYTTTPSEQLIQTYNKRIRVMQAIINQLRAAGQGRQSWEDDLKATREELDKAKLRITDLENELEQGVGELKIAAEQRDVAIANRDRYLKEAEEANSKCAELEHANRGLVERHATQEGHGHAFNDVIRLHNVIWGSQPVYDKTLDQKLLGYAAQGSSFTATRDLVDYDVGPDERRTLIIAYSKVSDGAVRWLVVDEIHEGGFNLL
ncbi:hypothetical protein F4781DRAFT_407926 [Annulohypoxylon bovei var. microspora]|nr:hypothetical protein F4781DRAFT_407926 [Annulohypoxylon bovei var. microspora]